MCQHGSNTTGKHSLINIGSSGGRIKLYLCSAYEKLAKIRQASLIGSSSETALKTVQRVYFRLVVGYDPTPAQRAFKKYKLNEM